MREKERVGGLIPHTLMPTANLNINRRSRLFWSRCADSNQRCTSQVEALRKVYPHRRSPVYRSPFPSNKYILDVILSSLEPLIDLNLPSIFRRMRHQYTSRQVSRAGHSALASFRPGPRTLSLTPTLTPTLLPDCTEDDVEKAKKKIWRNAKYNSLLFVLCSILFVHLDYWVVAPTNRSQIQPRDARRKKPNPLLLSASC